MSEGAAKRWMAARGWQPFAFQQLFFYCHFFQMPVYPVEPYHKTFKPYLHPVFQIIIHTHCR